MIRRWRTWRDRRRLKQLVDEWVAGGRKLSILPPTPRLCQHRRRHSWTEHAGTSLYHNVRCLDCGAIVSAANGAPLPDMPPMPHPADTQPSPGAAGPGQEVK